MSWKKLNYKKRNIFLKTYQKYLFPGVLLRNCHTCHFHSSSWDQVYQYALPNIGILYLNFPRNLTLLTFVLTLPGYPSLPTHQFTVPICNASVWPLCPTDCSKAKKAPRFGEETGKCCTDRKQTYRLYRSLSRNGCSHAEAGTSHARHRRSPAAHGHGSSSGIMPSQSYWQQQADANHASWGLGCSSPRHQLQQTLKQWLVSHSLYLSWGNPETTAGRF